uniref:Uncharacterized protein n=1 Tax=Rhipicephalus zambeziensis TaxID=60191 RepID=A0A224YAW2_9ACAR
MGGVVMCALFHKFLMSKVGKAWFLVGLVYGLCIAHWTKPVLPVFLVLVYLSGIVYDMYFVQHYVYYFCLCVQISCLGHICSLYAFSLRLSDLQSI